ncbi:MAG: CoA transferase [Chloroflexi bacterium]|nr:CoA transferase [Chloroflexota bacterium]
MADETGRAAALLSPYRVLDLTQEDGWLCGRLLADLGADVVKIEPPDGDPGRWHGPFYHDQVDPEKSLPWWAYNANKRGITLDLDTPGGQALFRRLAHKADFVIESYAPGYMAARGLGFQDLHGLFPQLVYTSITPFGQTGPYAAYHGSDLIAIAMSGFMNLVGEPDRPPLRAILPQAPMWTSMYAASGTLLAHHYRRKTGQGQHVDASLQAGMLWALANAPSFWTLSQQDLVRAGTQIVGRSIHGARMQAISPCRDGYINFIIYGGEAGKHSNQAMVAWMAERGMAPDWLKEKDWDKFNVATSTQEEIDAIEKPFSAFLATLTKEEFGNESAKRGILGYPVNNARDILEDPQLAARDFWKPVEHPELHAAFKYPGRFAKFSGSEPRDGRRAPCIGQHNDQVYVNELGLSKQELASLRQDRVV